MSIQPENHDDHAKGGESDDPWVELSLFYAKSPLCDDESPSPAGPTAEVLYGEGRLTTLRTSQSLRAENLGEGIRVLRIANSLQKVSDFLTGESFEHRRGGTKVDRFKLGLIPRPMVLGQPHEDTGTIQTPFGSCAPLRHFVRIDKGLLLTRLAGISPEKPQARQQLCKLLDRLANVSGVDMRGEHVQWLGDVLVGEKPERLAWWESLPSKDGDSCTSFQVHVTTGRSQPIDIQVRATGLDGMCVYDRLLRWTAEDNAARTVQLDEQLQSVFLRVWHNGQLAQEERSCLLRGFGGTVSMLGSTLNIADRLSEKVQGAVAAGAVGAELLSRVRRVDRIAMETTFVESMTSERWAGLNNTQHAVLSLLPPRAEQYARFPVGAEGRARAVLHFAELVSKAEEAYLVDPWFDVLGAQALLPRIRGNVALTIITNLATQDSDEQKKKLVAWLASCRGIGVPDALRVVCARSNRPGEQVFHDRFVLLRNGLRWRGIILTNSFSGLAASYPCFLAETPVATTALLIEEFKSLLANSDLDELWPAPTFVPRSRPVERGKFPYWCCVLAQLVSARGWSERRLLKAGKARGFLSSTGDGFKWHMDPSAREATLDALLGRAGRRSSRSGRRAWTRRAESGPRHRRQRRISVGRAVLMLGEMRARGFQIEAMEVASRLHESDSCEIERELRASFREGPDPTILTKSMRMERLGVRQSMAVNLAPVAAAKCAHSMWEYRVWDAQGESSSGRCFAYAVLALLSPELGVRCSEDLLDADFVLALRGGLHQRITVWPENLRDALLNARSPVLRALGVGAVFDTDARDDDNEPTFSAANLVALGVPPDERALNVAVWGMNAAESNFPAAAQMLVADLPRLAAPGLVHVLDALFAEEVRCQPFLEAVVAKLVERQGDETVVVLSAITDRFARRFRELPNKDFAFSHISVPLTRTMARAAAYVAKRQNTGVSHLVRTAAGSDRLQSRMSPLTPFRYPQGAVSCDVGLGWVVLWELLAAEVYHTCFADGMPIEVAAASARAYLATTRLPKTDDVLAAISSVLTALHNNEGNP